jgi:hypothetical protein
MLALSVCRRTPSGLAVPAADTAVPGLGPFHWTEMKSVKGIAPERQDPSRPNRNNFSQPCFQIRAIIYLTHPLGRVKMRRECAMMNRCVGVRSDPPSDKKKNQGRM